MAVIDQRDVINPRLFFSLKTIITVLVTLVGLGAVTTPAMAEKVKVGSAAAKNAMSSCKGLGGITFPKTGKDSTFGCVQGNASSGIVCGGVKASDKKTCDIFLRTPPRFPSRDEIRNAEMAEKESRKPALN